MPVAEQEQDPGRGPGRGRGPRGQPEQQAEPAVPERGRHGQRRGGHARHLHDAGQDVAGRAGSDAAHRRVRAEEPAGRGLRGRQRYQQQDAPGDQADHVARVAVPGGRQQASRGHRDRMPAHGRSARRAVSGTCTRAGPVAPPARRACQRRCSPSTTTAASSAHEDPSRIPAMASDIQWAAR